MTKLMSFSFRYDEAGREYKATRKKTTYALCEKEFGEFLYYYYGLNNKKICGIVIDIHDTYSYDRIPIDVVVRQYFSFDENIIVNFSKGRHEFAMYGEWHYLIADMFECRKKPTDFKFVKEIKYKKLGHREKIYKKTYWVELYYDKIVSKGKHNVSFV